MSFQGFRAPEGTAPSGQRLVLVQYFTSFTFFACSILSFLNHLGHLSLGVICASQHLEAVLYSPQACFKVDDAIRLSDG
jgi:hypothetical protein